MKTYSLEKFNDIETVRRINAAMVLNQLRRTGPISRPELAKLLDLSKVTISNIMFELNDLELTCEAGWGSSNSKGGRKPLLVQLNRDSRRVMAVCVKENGFDLALGDITGCLLRNSQVEFNKPADLAESIIEAVNRMLSESGILKEAILGLEVVSNPDLNPTFDPFYGSPEAFGRLLAERLSMPVEVEVSLKASAFGERWFGVGQKDQSFVYVRLNDRIDSTSVVNGVLNGQAIRLGDLSLPDGHSHFKSLADLASKRAIMSKACLDLSPDINDKELAELAEQNDPKAHGLFEHAGEALGLALSMVVNILGVQKFILAGRLAKIAPAFFLETVMNTLGGNSSEELRSEVEVLVGSLGERSGLMGGLALALDNWVYHTALLL